MKIKRYLFTASLLLAYWACNFNPEQGAATFEVASVEPYTATFNLTVPAGMEAAIVREPDVKGYNPDTLLFPGGNTFSMGLYLMNSEWEITLLLRPFGGGQWQPNRTLRLNNRFPWNKFRRVNPRSGTDTVITTVDVLPYFSAPSLPSCDDISSGWERVTPIQTPPNAWHLRLNSGVERKYYHFIVRPPNQQGASFVMSSDTNEVRLARPANLFCNTILTQPNPDSVRVWSANGIHFFVNSDWQMNIFAPTGTLIRVGSCTGCVTE